MPIQLINSALVLINRSKIVFMPIYFYYCSLHVHILTWFQTINNCLLNECL